MKKIYSLILVLAVLCSCSSDDTAPIANEPDPTGQEDPFENPIQSQLSGNQGLLKFIQNYSYNLSATYSSSYTIYYSYDSDKLSKIFNVSWSGSSGYSMVGSFVHTYTGNLITQIESLGPDNIVKYTTKYFYDNQERLIRMEGTNLDNFNVVEYIHNEDSSVTAVFKETNEAGVLEIVSTQTQYYNELGEMIKIIKDNIETQITYDTSNNPYKPIKGFDKLSIYGKNYSHLHNIINIRTITHIEGEPDQIKDTPETWTYNEASLPLSHTTTYDITANEEVFTTTSTTNYGYY